MGSILRHMTRRLVQNLAANSRGIIVMTEVAARLLADEALTGCVGGGAVVDDRDARETELGAVHYVNPSKAVEYSLGV